MRRLRAPTAMHPMTLARRTFLATSAVRATALLGASLAASRASAQGGDATLRVDAGDGRTETWSLARLKALPAETARASTREGATFEASGVSVATLLKHAGLDLSANLGSAPVAGRALIARAVDGYVAVFGLAEIDPHFGHPPALVVWTTHDGAPLSEHRGPFALVVPAESRPGRWVRQLVALEVRDLR
ncbi:MAG TPA: hypothetical protein VMU47_10140 [Caldimonas sp.]|nr:hypothetical protein [Caldimonas sp.]